MKHKKILLMLQPNWTPQIPPLGIATLKGYLRSQGYDNVKTVDMNIDPRVEEHRTLYLNLLKEMIPEPKRGNFYNIGNTVLRNHMMVHRTGDETGTVEVVRELIERNYIHMVTASEAAALDREVGQYYRTLAELQDRILETEQPEVLGISVYSDTLPASLLAFRRAKEYNPAIRTVMGGGIFADQLAPGTPDYDYFLERNPWIDKMIIGEGEHLFYRYLEGLLPGGERVYTREHNNGEILDINSLPAPDFTDTDHEYYPSQAAAASRSCPFQCAFCSETVQWGRYRKKDASKIAAQLEAQRRANGGQLFLMGDSLLNPVAGDLARELTESESAIYWDGYLRADKEVCDPETTIAWRKGGYYRARLGLESGSQRILELMGKRITLQQIKEALGSLANAGIKTTTYWVIGYPGETEEDFRQTLELIAEMRTEIYEAECNPFNYFVKGQVKSGKWENGENVVPLYPGIDRERLMIRTWRLEGEPGREETMARVARFVRHVREQGIPNPYALKEIDDADRRWQELHRNAVPPHIHFKNKNTRIDDRGKVKLLRPAQRKPREEKSFVF
jgi:radical SAM superfamily enzyme YgiQ (UPF0313 family)